MPLPVMLRMFSVSLFDSMVLLNVSIYCECLYTWSSLAAFLVKPNPSFVNAGVKSVHSVGMLLISCTQMGMMDLLHKVESFKFDLWTKADCTSSLYPDLTIVPFLLYLAISPLISLILGQ